MEFLVSIIPIVKGQYRISSRSFLPKDSKLKQLFDAVAAGKASTDAEAAALLYKSAPQEKRYLMLKKELKGKVINRLLETALKGGGQSVTELKLHCRKQIIIAELLMAHALTAQAEKVLYKAMLQAEQCALVPIQKTCLRLLKQIAAQQANAKKIAGYKEKLNTLSILENRMDEADSLYALLKTKDRFTIAPSPEIAAGARRDAEILEKWLHESSHPVFQLYYYRLQAVAGWHGQDANLLRKLIEKWYQLPGHHSFLRNDPHLAEINLAYWQYCMQVGETDKAWQLIERSLRYLQITNENKFALYEAGFATLLRMRRYEAAGKMLLKAVKHLQFPHLHVYEKSRWMLNQAYLYYIFLCKQQAGHIKQFTPDFSNGTGLIELEKQLSPLDCDKQGSFLQWMMLKPLLYL